jgi:uncharacterized protein YcsI (UPF0317 family)
MNTANDYRLAHPREVRAAARAGLLAGPTAGMARGYVQANLVILPAEEARDFADFCHLNDRPCPLLEETRPGDPQPGESAPGADLRSDLPRYRVFDRGVPRAEQPTNIREMWRDDFVAFLLGCSFTFETALEAAGLLVRHLHEGANVPMYRTNVPCRPAGRFAGPLVVSMRPYRPEQIDQVIEITSRYPRMHGAPVHMGDPAALGIVDLGRPDFGDAVTIREGEIPVFWACGVTPQLAMAAAAPEIAITHSPGCMFVTDWKEETFCTT